MRVAVLLLLAACAAASQDVQAPNEPLDKPDLVQTEGPDKLVEFVTGPNVGIVGPTLSEGKGQEVEVEASKEIQPTKKEQRDVSSSVSTQYSEFHELPAQQGSKEQDGTFPHFLPFTSVKEGMKYIQSQINKARQRGALLKKPRVVHIGNTKRMKGAYDKPEEPEQSNQSEQSLPETTILEMSPAELLSRIRTHQLNRILNQSPWEPKQPTEKHEAEEPEVPQSQSDESAEASAASETPSHASAENNEDPHSSSTHEPPVSVPQDSLQNQIAVSQKDLHSTPQSPDNPVLQFFVPQEATIGHAEQPEEPSIPQLEANENGEPILHAPNYYSQLPSIRQDLRPNAQANQSINDLQNPNTYYYTRPYPILQPSRNQVFSPFAPSPPFSAVPTLQTILHQFHELNKNSQAGPFTFPESGLPTFPFDKSSSSNPYLRPLSEPTPYRLGLLPERQLANPHSPSKVTQHRQTHDKPPQGEQPHRRPQNPQSPETSQVYKSPEGPQVHQSAQNPKAHQTPQRPQVHNIHAGPQAPELYERPQTLQYQGAPQALQYHHAGPQAPKHIAGPLAFPYQDRLKALRSYSGQQAPKPYGGFQGPQISTGYNSTDLLGKSQALQYHAVHQPLNTASDALTPRPHAGQLTQFSEGPEALQYHTIQENLKPSSDAQTPRPHAGQLAQFSEGPQALQYHTVQETLKPNSDAQTPKPHAGPQPTQPHERPKPLQYIAGPQVFQPYAGPQAIQNYAFPQPLQYIAGPQALQSFHRPQALQSYTRPQILQPHERPQALESYEKPQALQTYEKPQAIEYQTGSQAAQNQESPEATPSSDKPPAIQSDQVYRQPTGYNIRQRIPSYPNVLQSVPKFQTPLYLQTSNSHPAKAVSQPGNYIPSNPTYELSSNKEAALRPSIFPTANPFVQSPTEQNLQSLTPTEAGKLSSDKIPSYIKALEEAGHSKPFGISQLSYGKNPGSYSYSIFNKHS